MLRFVYTCLTGFFITALTGTPLVGATPAAASVILCEANCVVDGTPPTHQSIPFDFEIALRAEENDSIDLDISGSLYIFGDIMTNGGDVLLEAMGTIEFGGDIQIQTNGGDLTLDAPGGTTPIPPIIPGPRLPGDGGGVILIAALLAPSVPLEIEGDVFLHLEGITLSSLTVHVGQDIVMSPLNPIVTPEPGTILLLGFGLGILAIGRTR